MSIYALRSLRKQTTRMVLSICGIALSILLMLFLLAAYNGVKKGSMDYIEKNRADLWILQKNAKNILRCTSVLFSRQSNLLTNIHNVKSVSPVVLLLATIGDDKKEATIYLAGYDPVNNLGGPPEIVEGRNIENDNEIVLDHSFAKKYGYHIGDTLTIKNDILNIVGISTGTNAFVIQYAFVTIKKAQSLLKYPIVTTFLVELTDKSQLNKTKNDILHTMDDIEVYDQKTFIENNLRELKAGFLPFVLTIVGIGVVVLTVVLSLLLSINIIEKRRDFAIMKIIGSSEVHLIKEVISQSYLLATLGLISAFVCLWPLIIIIEILSPEVTVIPSLSHFLQVLIIVKAVAVVSAGFSILKLRNIYPMEVFR